MNKKDNQDVLKAILNVKRYAKNLKKNAITMQQIQTDEHYEITSTPSLFPHNRQFFFDEISSPVLNQGSSFRQSIPYKKRISNDKSAKAVKDYSMSNIIHKKNIKPEESFTKLNHAKKSRKQSSEEQPDYLMQSMQVQSIKSSYKGYNPTEEKKITKEEKEKRLEMWNKIVDSQEGQKQKFVVEEGSYDIIKELMKQIEYLNEQLTNYKTVMITMKRDYLRMQEKANEKIALEHYIDILKEEINSLQNENFELKEIISLQNQKVNKFETTIANIAEKFKSQYQDDVHNMCKTQVINQILLRLTRQIQLKDQPQLPSTQSELNTQPELKLSNLCRSDQQLKNKWKTNLPI